jgi:hypothetical protein
VDLSGCQSGVRKSDEVEVGNRLYMRYDSACLGETTSLVNVISLSMLQNVPSPTLQQILPFLLNSVAQSSNLGQKPR